MPETLESLEERKTALYQELREIGEFRRGTISANYRKCGRANCVCAQAGHPGHGPQYLLSATIGGQSVAKNLHLGPELEKAGREVENYRCFVQWGQQWLEVNEQLCQQRSVPTVENPSELEQLKKKLQKQYSKKWKKR
jgi:hypothetical protein